MTNNYTRITITMPNDLIAHLKRNSANISKYISDTINERMIRERKERAWKELVAGPATFTTIADPVAYIEELRAGDEERMTRLGI